MKIGSQEHRDTFCRHFMQTYTEFDPDTLPWPELGRGGAATSQIRALLGRGFLYRAPRRRDRRGLHRNRSTIR